MMNRLLKFAAWSAILSAGQISLAQDGSRQADVTPEIRKTVLEKMSSIIKNQAFIPGVDFSKWDSYIEDQRADLDKANTPDDFARVVNRALNKFGASHIVFSTPEAVMQQRTGQVVGLGIVPEIVADGMKVNDVFEGSAAAEAGLEAGDIILEADGKKPDAITSLRGEAGTKVSLKVRKAKTNKVVSVEITRRAFSTRKKETLSWINSDTALLKIPSFMVYDRDNVEKLIGEARGKAKTLAVDLRSNGGGYVYQLLHLSSLLLPKETPIGTFLTRSAVDEYVKATSGSPTDYTKVAEFTKRKVVAAGSKKEGYSGNLVVLINGGSGSASEILAAALKEVAGAPVIGTRSAGAVLASTMWQLPEGYQIQFPFQDYVTIKGVRLEGNGVVPDMEAATPRSSSEADPAVNLILEITKKASGKASGK